MVISLPDSLHAKATEAVIRPARVLTERVRLGRRPVGAIAPMSFSWVERAAEEVEFAATRWAGEPHTYLDSYPREDISIAAPPASPGDRARDDVIARLAAAIDATLEWLTVQRSFRFWPVDYNRVYPPFFPEPGPERAG
jgi:hypothetical protein